MRFLKSCATLIFVVNTGFLVKAQAHSCHSNLLYLLSPDSSEAGNPSTSVSQARKALDEGMRLAATSRRMRVQVSKLPKLRKSLNELRTEYHAMIVDFHRTLSAQAPQDPRAVWSPEARTSAHRFMENWLATTGQDHLKRMQQQFESVLAELGIIFTTGPGVTVISRNGDAPINKIAARLPEGSTITVDFTSHFRIAPNFAQRPLNEWLYLNSYSRFSRDDASYKLDFTHYLDVNLSDSLPDSIPLIPISLLHELTHHSLANLPESAEFKGLRQLSYLPNFQSTGRASVFAPAYANGFSSQELITFPLDALEQWRTIYNELLKSPGASKQRQILNDVFAFFSKDSIWWQQWLEFHQVANLVSGPNFTKMIAKSLDETKTGVSCEECFQWSFNFDSTRHPFDEKPMPIVVVKFHENSSPWAIRFEISDAETVKRAQQWLSQEGSDVDAFINWIGSGFLDVSKELSDIVQTQEQTKNLILESLSQLKVALQHNERTQVMPLIHKINLLMNTLAKPTPELQEVFSYL